MRNRSKMNSINFTIEHGVLVIEENPEWFVSSARQMANILEGVPTRLSMMDTTHHNSKATFFLLNIEDEDLLNIFTRIEPRRVNFTIMEILKHLYEIKRIDDLQMANGMRLLGRTDSTPYSTMKASVNELTQQMERAQARVKKEQDKKRVAAYLERQGDQCI